MDDLLGCLATALRKTINLSVHASSVLVVLSPNSEGVLANWHSITSPSRTFASYHPRPLQPLHLPPCKRNHVHYRVLRVRPIHRHSAPLEHVQPFKRDTSPSTSTASSSLDDKLTEWSGHLEREGVFENVVVGVLVQRVPVMAKEEAEDARRAALIH
ncbi:uncharacterized protein LACBIDRAFT_310749 [Laccaria bicolor S238N-H82]|uniref:Predicted protein n=1 Tax=Laccaria bicolor (strain S238N-H82 / ATCC MYA-4686) TaxID=486041 RepID=B0DV07_LACBS|nr:uncharacterized protein LACBIDRAFT_310749 [Laccaria bicolor S238N-H82]EDR01632.1 predicted protein [Laccaria bicolor S238N-H82]|eukprot:XP_001887708.1 predicted protein [Laccaria bicolor S238N-H82]